MLVEPVKGVGKTLVPPAQARLPAEREISQESRERGTNSPDAPELTQMTEAVADIQKNLNMIHNVDLQFSVHKASGEMMVIVREESTGDVIREIPPSEMLDLAARLGEMVGLLFDQTG